MSEWRIEEEEEEKDSVRDGRGELPKEWFDQGLYKKEADVMTHKNTSFIYLS